MTNLIKGIIAVICVTLVTSCTKTGELVDTDALPEVQLYIPGSNEEMYIPGNNTIGSYVLDTEQMSMQISLGVARIGAGAKRSFSVDVALDTDTVAKLIGALGDNNLHFPEDRITIPDKVLVSEGQDGGVLEVQLNLTEPAGLVGKVLVFALQLTESEGYSINPEGSIKLVRVNYDELLGNPTLVDEFESQEYTENYATISGQPLYQTVNNPENFFNDATRVMRTSSDAIAFTYEISKIASQLPFAKALSGFKINALGPPLPMSSLMAVFYSIDDGQTFHSVKDIIEDAVNTPESLPWTDFYWQSALPQGTTHLRIELTDQSQTGVDPWNPLLRRVEIFYEGGASYNYERP